MRKRSLTVEQNPTYIGNPMSQQIGFAAEASARHHLLAQGLSFVTSNYRCKSGEIDLIMRDKTHLVFIEVRSRTSRLYGGASVSITRQKQQKILKTALYYLSTHKLHEKYPIRFDVISMDGVPAKINWIQNAFGVDY